MPAHISPETVLSHIPPEKDVDGLHPFNIGSLALKNHSPFFISCTPLAVQQTILHAIHKRSSKPHIFNKLTDRNVKKPL